MNEGPEHDRQGSETVSSLDQPKEAVLAIEPARMPRRFGIGTGLVVMTIYAVLFSVLGSLRARTSTVVFFAVFLAAILAGQTLLFRGKRPRLGSIIAGVPAWIGLGALERWEMYQSLGGGVSVDLSGMLFATVILGTLSSYVFGWLVASVFLFMDRIRTGRWNPPHETIEPSTTKPSSPWDQAH